MEKCRQILSGILAGIFCMVLFCGTVSAEETSGEEYFSWNESSLEERIDTNGNFTFAFRRVVYGNVFYVDSSTITIAIAAHDGLSSNHEQYKVRLCKKYTGMDEVGDTIASRTFTADGEIYTWTIRGLSSTQGYQLAIQKPDIYGNYTNTLIDGNGHVTNVTAMEQ